MYRSVKSMEQKVLIIDAHPVFVQKTQGFIKGLTFKDIAVTASGAEGLFLAVEWRPELVILSGQLPDIDTVEICRKLKVLDPSPKLIVQIGLFTSEDAIESFIQAGADVVLDRKEKDWLPLENAISKLMAE